MRGDARSASHEPTHVSQTSMGPAPHAAKSEQAGKFLAGENSLVLRAKQTGATSFFPSTANKARLTEGVNTSAQKKWSVKPDEHLILNQNYTLQTKWAGRLKTSKPSQA